jgi:hypothetical protein
VIKVYGRLIEGVRSTNQLNRLQIALENIMTPLEAEQFAPRLAPALSARLLAIHGPAAEPLTAMTIGERLFERTHAWRRRLQRQMALVAKAEPEGFTRLRLSRDVRLYSNPGASGPKRLLILFSSLALRPMMPVHVFLQHVDARTTDVMFLRDSERDAFRSGLFGLGTTLHDVIDRLPRLVDLSRYQSVSTMGTSGGGVPALVAGLSLGARAAISAGGLHPVGNYGTFGDRPLEKALEDLRQVAGSRTHVFLITGAKAVVDGVAAEATAALLGATRLTISGTDDAGVGHNSLFALAQQGRLARVLEAMLSVDTESLRDVASISLSQDPRPGGPAS